MKTLLLIDEDRKVLHMLATTLSHQGYEVIPRPDAKAALFVLREGASVDLIITDGCMLEMDVMEFLVQVKKMRPSVPIIVLTGNGNVETYLKALSIGVFDYMNKPVRVRDLERVIHAALASVEENPATRHDHAPCGEHGSAPASQGHREQARCRFVFGTNMLSCGKSREVYVPSAGELQDYCQTSLHASCPRYSRDESALNSDESAQKYWMPGRNTRGK